MARTRNRRAEGERLREEIIEGASDLLGGAEEPQPLSLRAVAREVGIAPQSMYLHFTEKSQLVWAVVERRFAGLFQASDEAASRASGPAARLRARCLAYCAWGLDHPGHYRLLFETRATGQLDVPYNESPGAEVFERLVAAVQECMEAGEAPLADTTAVAVSLWIGLHGIVSLRLSKPGFPWPQVELLADRVLLGLAGVRASL